METNIKMKRREKTKIIDLTDIFVKNYRAIYAGAKKSYLKIVYRCNGPLTS